MWNAPPLRPVGRTWIELERDGAHAVFRCRLCHRLAVTGAYHQPPTPCVCERRES